MEKQIIEQIENLINLGESYQVEFKKSENQVPDSMWETYSAFANTNGGYIFLGIEDDGNGMFKSVTGVKNPDKVISDIFNHANNKDLVNVNLLSNETVFKINYKDKTMIMVYVQEAPVNLKPVYLKKKLDLTYIRRGESDQRADKETITYLLNTSHNTYDTVLLDNYDISDLNYRDIEEYLSMYNSVSSLPINENLPMEEKLKILGVLRRDRRNNSRLKLTLGGLLFFGKYNSIRDYYPHFQLDYFKINDLSDVRWDDRVSTGDMAYPEMNIFRFYKEVLPKLLSTAEDHFQLDNSQQRLPFRKDLQEAVREAFINTLMHAYYGSSDATRINAYTDYYKFYNPGKMLVSTEEFFEGGVSKTNNEVISTLFRKIGISEKAGSGGRKIAEVTQKYKLRPPEIISSFDNTTIILWKEDLLSTLKLPENEFKIMEFMIKKIAASKKESCDAVKLSDYFARAALSNLVEQNLLRISGSGRSTRYVLTQDTLNTKHAIRRHFLSILEH